MQNNFQDYIISNANDQSGKSIKKTGISWHIDEHKFIDNLTYGVFINSAIAKGRIASIDISKLKKISGVHAVLCYFNKPDLPEWQKKAAQTAGYGGRKHLPLFNDDKISYYQQPLALVIANSFTLAVSASKLVKISYLEDAEPADFESSETGFTYDNPTKKSGEYTHETFSEPHVTIESRYDFSFQVNNHLKIQAALGIIDTRNELTGDNRAMAMRVIKKKIASSFNLEEEDIRVHIQPGNTNLEPIGGILPHEMAAVLGIKKTGKPLLVLASCGDLFQMSDCKNFISQHLAIESSIHGIINSVTHQAHDYFSHEFKTRVISCAALYACKSSQVFNTTGAENLSPFDIIKPDYQDASFALESALDELAYLTNVDPVVLRINNFTEPSNASGSSSCENYLKQCCTVGAQNFGWSTRIHTAGSMRLEQCLLGMGMSAGAVAVGSFPELIIATFKQDGKLILQSNLAEKKSIEILISVTAGILDIDISRVHIITDVTMPGLDGNTTMPIFPVIYEAIQVVKRKLIQVAGNDFLMAWRSGNTDILVSENNTVRLKAADQVIVDDGLKKTAKHFFCANFVEVIIDPDTKRMDVSRVVTAVDARLISNMKETARLIYDLVVREIAICLSEQNQFNNYSVDGIHENFDFQSLHSKLNAPIIEVVFVNQATITSKIHRDEVTAPIELTGLSAAIANAVHHATGRRIRTLPIKL